LRAAELDKRREVGVIVRDASAARQFREVFEGDWARVSGKSTENGEVADKEAKGSAMQLAEAV
jgi:hypothetical protein